MMSKSSGRSIYLTSAFSISRKELQSSEMCVIIQRVLNGPLRDALRNARTLHQLRQAFGFGWRCPRFEPREE